MRTYLAVAPVWIVAVVYGVVFGLIWTAGTAVQDHRFGWRLLVIGVAVGAMFGVAMGFVVRRQRRRTGYVLDGLSAVQRRAVSRAVATGTPPEDSALCAAAVAMAHDALTEYTRTKTASISVCAVLAVVSAVYVIDSWWYLGAAVLFVTAMVSMLRYPVRLRKRIGALELANDRGERRRLAAQ